MSVAEILNYTYKDYEMWEGEWELIDGMPVSMAPAPARIHQSIASELFYYLKQALDEECQACEVLYEVDWKISNNTILRPDIIFTCDDDGTFVDIVDRFGCIHIQRIDKLVKIEHRSVPFLDILALFAQELCMVGIDCRRTCRHRTVHEYFAFGQFLSVMHLLENTEQFLRTFYSEGGNHHIAPIVHGIDDNLLVIICVDISLKNVLKIVHPTSMDSVFGKVGKWVYSAFSVALFMVALLLFVKGVSGFLSFGLDFSHIDINEMFKSTILLTLSLAIVDLTKAIFEEEVLGREKHRGSSEESHQTMIRFLGSIIIALSIEALMLVFKFALTDPEKLLFAVYLLVGITALILGLSVYLKVNQKREKDTSPR